MTRFALLFALLTLTLGCPDSNTGGPLSDATSDTPEDTRDDAIDAPEDVAPDTPPALGPYPEPGVWPANTGPGGPSVSFTQEQLYENCAFVDGGEKDKDHHNLVVMYDGYLLMPWATEWGGGGLTFYNFDDPCNVSVAGTGYDRTMRETHSIGFSHHNGAWAVVNFVRKIDIGGIQFWDISDIKAPKMVSTLATPDFFYPDAYKRVTQSVFWQGRYVFVAASQAGVHVVDALDPTAPEVVATYQFDPVMQAGQVQAIGNLLVVTTAGQSRTVLLDISDPLNPQPISPQSDFTLPETDGELSDAYFSNTQGGYIYYAAKNNGGGLLIYDIHDPANPVYRGGIRSGGGGSYVFFKEGRAFVGESSFASMYDLSDMDNITQMAQFNLTGDLDTITPIGNVVVLSVDDKSNKNEASAVAPYAMEPDTSAPEVTWTWPSDGATNLPVTSRVGVTFNEMIDVKSAWEGSVRLWRTDAPSPDAGRVAGLINAQENIVNFAPMEPLEPNTSYTLEIPAGGVADFNGNALQETFRMTLTTQP